MPDNTPEGAADQDAPETGANASDKTFTQAQVNDLIAREKGQIKSRYDDYDDLKAKAAEFDKVSETQKTEQQRLEERAAGAETRASTAESRALRYEVAAKHGLDLAAAGRLQGSTQEELEADAVELKALLGQAQLVDMDGGARSTTAPTGMNDFIRAGSKRT